MNGNSIILMIYDRIIMVKKKSIEIVAAGNVSNKHLKINLRSEIIPFDLESFFAYSSLYMLQLNNVLNKKYNLKNIRANC